MHIFFSHLGLIDQLPEYYYPVNLLEIVVLFCYLCIDIYTVFRILYFKGVFILIAVSVESSCIRSPCVVSCIAIYDMAKDIINLDGARDTNDIKTKITYIVYIFLPLRGAFSCILHSLKCAVISTVGISLFRPFHNAKRSSI